MGIDHGGSTTTAVVVSEEGLILGRDSEPTRRRTPQPGWVEHDPDDFVDGSILAASRAVESAGLAWSDVAAVGIANQGETSIAWDADSGRPVGPALSWQDKRTAERCDELRSIGRNAEDVSQISGLSIDPYFSASKYAWLSKATDEARTAMTRGSLRLGGTDAYLMSALTTGRTHATDHSSLSRTALMDLDKAEWSEQLVEIFGVPLKALPTVQKTTSDFGVITHEAVAVSGIPITAGIVDTNASQFMHELWSPGAVKATLGTGAFIETSAGNRPLRPLNGLAPFIGWSIGDDLRYVLEGSVYDVGAAVDWAVEMGIASSAAETAALAASVPDSSSVSFVPAFSGLAAPHWNSDARAAITGISLETGRAHIARALLEGIGLAMGEAIHLLRESAGQSEITVMADGGPSQNPFLMQMLADVLGHDVHVVAEPDITGYGVACLAGLSIGHFSLDNLRSLKPTATTYEPKTSAVFREAKRAEWKRSADWVISRHAQ